MRVPALCTAILACVVSSGRHDVVQMQEIRVGLILLFMAACLNRELLPVGLAYDL